MVEANSNPIHNLPVGKSIPFITISEEDGNETPEFSVSTEAMTFLGQLTQQDPEQTSKKIAVILFGGPCNTGKSFLANQFIAREGESQN